MPNLTAATPTAPPSNEAAPALPTDPPHPGRHRVTTRELPQQAAIALTVAAPALLWLLVGTVTMSAGALLADGAATPSWLGFALIAVAIANVPAAARVSGHTGGWWFIAALAALADQVAASMGLVVVRYALASLAAVAGLRAFSLFYEKRGLHKRYARPAGPFFRSTG